MEDIDMGEYTDTFNYLVFREKELSEYLSELKKEYIRVLKRGNIYAVDVMHDKYKATRRIYMDNLSHMKELIEKQRCKQKELIVK